MRRDHKDTRTNSGGCGEGPIENVQSPDFCAYPSVFNLSINAETFFSLWITKFKIEHILNLIRS